MATQNNPEEAQAGGNHVATLNEQYGLTEVYQHDLNEAGVCKKCHRPVSELKYKLCAVIGKEEVARFRDYDER